MNSWKRNSGGHYENPAPFCYQNQVSSKGHRIHSEQFVPQMKFETDLLWLLDSLKTNDNIHYPNVFRFHNDDKVTLPSPQASFPVERHYHCLWEISLVLDP